MAKKRKPTVAELVELLVRENEKLDTTNKEVKESLEELIEIIYNMEFNVDMTIINNSQSEFIDRIGTLYENQQRRLEDFDSKKEKSKQTPRWLAISFAAIVFLFLSSISLNIYQNVKINKVETAVFQEGVDYMKNHFLKFIKEHPNCGELYQKWNKNSNQ